jgi:hypothetical protein
MSVNNKPLFVGKGNAVGKTFVNADGASAKDLVVADTTYGTKVLAMLATSDDDTDPVVVDIYLHDGSNAFRVGSVNVPADSGTDGATATVDLMGTDLLPWLDTDGEFFLPDGWKIQVAPAAAVGSGHTLTVVCIAGDFERNDG